MKTLLTGATIVNEGKSFRGSIVIEDGMISEILTHDADTARQRFDRKVDVAGCFVLPGVIDDHVHFRQPGLTAKADIASESRAAAYGGVTSYFDMPNTVPQTTTIEALEEKKDIARHASLILLRCHRHQHRPLSAARYAPHAGHKAVYGLFYGQHAC